MKKEILMIIFCFLFLFSSCQEGDTETEVVTPYIGGEEGLQMKFVEGMPPDYIFDNGGYEFGIGVQLDNVGEDDIEEDEAYIEIIGINPKDFNLNSQDDLKKNLDSDLTGAKKNFEGTELPGGRTVVEFAGLNYVDDLHGNAGIKIRAELCYKYRTYTSTKLCIKKEVLENIASDKICDLTGDKTPVNSGGPVHITSLKETPMGENKIQMAFVIENVKSVPGTIFKRGTECDDSLNNPELNKVWVEIKTDIDGVKPECSGLQESTDKSKGYVTLYSGEPRTVTCSLDLSGVDSIFEKVFEIELEYNYLQYLERPLEIRDVSANP
ncbi:hypothetical protein JXB41_01355 [Candidatus Woesearchaeota archaeon]|nr:hypothetical protein [Candidatus Woesearchaeota archaeon]